MKTAIHSDRLMPPLHDGLEMGGMTIVAAMGIDTDGKKHILGLVEGGSDDKSDGEKIMIKKRGYYGMKKIVTYWFLMVFMFGCVCSASVIAAAENEIPFDPVTSRSEYRNMSQFFLDSVANAVFRNLSEELYGSERTDQFESDLLQHFIQPNYITPNVPPFRIERDDIFFAPLFLMWGNCYNFYYSIEWQPPLTKGMGNVQNDAIKIAMDLNEKYSDIESIPESEWKNTVNSIHNKCETYQLHLESFERSAVATSTPQIVAEAAQPANTLTYVFADGVAYDGKTYYGIMRNGKPDVFGVLLNEETGFFYYGGFKDGLYHTYGYDNRGEIKSYGNAYIKLESGERYVVNFRDGKPHGFGFYYDSDDIVHDATWRKGVVEGGMNDYPLLKDTKGQDYKNIVRTTDIDDNLTIGLSVWEAAWASQRSIPPQIQIARNGNISLRTDSFSYSLSWKKDSGNWQYGSSLSSSAYLAEGVNSIDGVITDNRPNENGERRDGKTSSGSGNGSTGGGASISQPTIPSLLPTSKKWQNCRSCFGKGGRDCLTCNGDGWVETAYVGRIDGKEVHEAVRCTNITCSNGWIKCISCSGDGGKWVDE